MWHLVCKAVIKILKEFFKMREMCSYPQGVYTLMREITNSIKNQNRINAKAIQVNLTHLVMAIWLY